MLNKLKRTAKEGTSKFIKAIAVVGTTLFITLNVNANPTSADVQKEIKEVFKKNPDKEIVVKVENNQSTEKTAKFEAVQDSIDALDFAVQNVDKYYPDMKEHLTTMINSFRDQEHRDSTLALLNKMTANISDPAQKVGAIIYCLERRVFYKSTFASKYDTKIADQTFDEMLKFEESYITRFNGYYDRLEKKIEEQKIIIKRQEDELQKLQEELQKSQEELQKSQEELQKSQEELQKSQEELQKSQEELQKSQEELQKSQEELQKSQEELQKSKEELQKSQEELQKSQEELQKNIQELETNMSKFSPEEVKSNTQLKELVKTTEQRYLENGFAISAHLQSLFDAAK